MKRVVLVAAASVLALAACSKKADTAGGASANASATAPESSKPAVAMSAPTRKAGLWEQSMNLGKMTQVMKMCIDEATEQKMKWYATESRAGADNPCTEQSVTPKLGGGWSFHSVCKMGESGKIVSDGNATGDFGSHYVVKITSVTTGSSMPQANGTHEMTMEGTWKGACPAGMKGGDIQLANGMTFNPTDTAHLGGLKGSGPGGRMTPDDIAKLRAQSREMAKAAHEAQ